MVAMKAKPAMKASKGTKKAVVKEPVLKAPAVLAKPTSKGTKKVAHVLHPLRM